MVQQPGATLQWSVDSRLLGIQQLEHTGSVVAAPGLESTGSATWHIGLVAPPHEGSSRTRDRTRVSCIGRRVLYH